LFYVVVGTHPALEWSNTQEDTMNIRILAALAALLLPAAAAADDTGARSKVGALTSELGLSAALYVYETGDQDLDLDVEFYQGGERAGILTCRVSEDAATDLADSIRNVSLKSTGEMHDWAGLAYSNLSERQDITISLRDEGSESILVWKVLDCWPVQVEGPGLKATGNEVAIESLEVVMDSATFE
jgi:phage tail-like protein